MFAPTAVLPARPPRRLILGTAFLLALLVSLPTKSPAIAQDAKLPAVPATPAAPAQPSTPTPPAKAAADGASHGISINIGVGPEKDEAKAIEGKATDEAATSDPDGPGTIRIKKNGKTITLTGIPRDREFDSMGQFIHNEPALASGVVVIVAVVFLAPVLAIALILGYRMRKARMLNETMLKLAEKGALAPGEALEALASGTGAPARTVAAAQYAGGLVNLNEQARDIRRRAAWSDLRKGVVMGAIGLAVTLYSLFDDRSPNIIGLVLLFVGAGYVVLWWFEERQMAPKARGNAASSTGAGDPNPGGPA